MKKLFWFTLLLVILMIPMSVSAFQNETAESSFSVTASKSEAYMGESIELTVKATGVDAVRLWDGKRDTMLKEFPATGGLTVELALSVPLNVPGTAIYYLTAAKDGFWSKDRSSRVMIKVKAPQNSGAPNVVPAKSESDFLGTWRIKYAGIPSGGSYQIAEINVDNDMSFIFGPGYLTVGTIPSTKTSFEDGILFTKQGTFELTDKGFLSNYQDQGFNALLEKVSDEYPAASDIPEASSETEEEPEKYTVGRPMYTEPPKTVQAADENEFLGTWELCYALASGNTVMFNSELLGENAKAYYYITSGYAKYSTPSNYSAYDYSAKFVSGKLDLGTAELSMNDNGMISEEINGNILYFCKAGEPEPAAEGTDAASAGAGSGTSEDHTPDSTEDQDPKVSLTVSQSTIEVGKTFTLTVSAPGAEGIRLYSSLSSDPEKPLKEAEGDTLEYRRIAVRSSEESYYAVASYNGEWSERSNTEEVAFLPGSKLRVNCPETANAGEDLRITIYETADTEEYSVRIRDEAGSIVKSMRFHAGTANISSLPKGKYTVTVICVGNEDRTMTLPLEIN